MYSASEGTNHTASIVCLVVARMSHVSSSCMSSYLQARTHVKPSKLCARRLLTKKGVKMSLEDPFSLASFVHSRYQSLGVLAPCRCSCPLYRRSCPLYRRSCPFGGDA